jgi:hypothetical protein
VSRGRWVLSTRTRGEVLTAGADLPALQLRLLAVPGDFSAAEVEAWLGDVAQVASEAILEESEPATIPGLLRHALTGMLFSHAELWDRGAAVRPCSVVFVRTDEEVGFGVVGTPEISLQVDGRTVEPQWIAVRDDRGGEARAWRADIDCEVRLRVVWTSGALDAPAARLEADFTPEKRVLSEPPHSEELAAAATRPEETAFSPSSEMPAGERPSSGIARWLQRTAGQTRSPVPTAPLTAPLPDEPRRVDEPFVPLSARLDPDTPDEVFDRIPPTPEPLSITRHALVPEELRGPREIELPAPAVATPPEFAPARAEEPPSDLAPPPAVKSPVSAEPTLVLDARDDAAAPRIEPPAPDTEPVVAFAEPEADVAETVGAPPEIEMPLPARTVRARIPRQPVWPTAGELERHAPRAVRRRRIWPWIAGGALLLVIGWLVGSLQDSNGTGRSKGGIAAIAKRLGLGGPHFTVELTSIPDGATIAVDGKPIAERTPATLDLPVGEHQVTISFGDHGATTVPVRGDRKDERVELAVPAWGALEVFAPETGSLIAVTVDGAPRGYAPLLVDSLAPGVHDVRFSGPGLGSWGETVAIRVRETQQILARPMHSPATGLLQIRAETTAGGEAQPIAGARVWVDGESRGVTPLTLELPRGPHSIRVQRGEDEAPVQVIDLPGGNQRFATFDLGAEGPAVTLKVSTPPRIPLDRSVVISASLEGALPSDVREMVLHARTPDGTWRRYPMTLLATPTGAVGAIAFPVPLLGPQGRTLFYVSAVTSQGDEHYTEMQRAVGETRR